MEIKIHKYLSLKNAIIFLIPVIYFLFYSYVGFDLNVLKIIMFITSAILTLFFIANINKLRCFERNSYGRYISILMAIVSFSILNALLYWGQDPISTFRACASMTGFIYFFVLRKFKTSFKVVNSLIFIFAAIYILLWLYAVSQAPRVVFGLEEEINDSRGFFRPIVPGIHFVAMAYFIFLHRAIYNEKGLLLLWICLSVICFIVVFLSMSRTLLLALVCFSLFYLIKSKPIVGLGIVLLLYFSANKLISDSEILSSLSELTVNEMSDSQYGSRTSEYSNFLKVYPFHIGTTLFGNGAPHVISSYGQYEESIKDGIGFNRSDSGWIDFYVTYGLLSVILLVSLAIKVFKQPKPTEATPYELFVYYLFITALTGNTILAGSSALVMALYVLEKFRTKNINESTNVRLW